MGIREVCLRYAIIDGLCTAQAQYSSGVYLEVELGIEMWVCSRNEDIKARSSGLFFPPSSRPHVLPVTADPWWGGARGEKVVVVVADW